MLASKKTAKAIFSTQPRSSRQSTALLKSFIAGLLFWFSATALALSSCVLNSSSASVVICSPANGATVSSPVLVEAAVANTMRSLQVVLDGKIAYRSDSNTISQQFSMTQGQHTISVQAKGASGPWITSAVTITVGSPQPPISVSVSPPSATLSTGGTQSLNATVTGSTNTAVIWSVNGVSNGNSAIGTISPSGLYAAPDSVPNPSTVTVTATSQADNTKTASASITITVAPIIGISLSPTSASLQPVATQQFTPTITGTTNTAVSWSTSAGTFSSPPSGSPANSILYTAPAALGSYTVIAKSVADPTKSASATVTVIQLTITPSTATLLTSGTRTQVFNATVSGGSGSQVNFYASGGTISTAGNSATFTAPSGPGTYTVTASLAGDPSISAAAVVTVVLPSLTVYEVDGVTQTNRPITFGRVFAQSDIALCPQPVVGGTAGVGGTPAANWQADVKNRWPDGSVKFAIISFTQSLSPTSSTEVTFQSVAPANGGCNNTGALIQAQMTGFNSGNWGAQTVVTPAGGAAVTTDAKAMLAASDPSANTFGDCKNDYWLKGPVVTAVIVQDCTSASANDFGWTWNGTAMTNPVTGNAPTASVHPMFLLYFYPGSNSVYVETIIEIPWSGRRQNQKVALNFRGGVAQTSIYNKSTFEMVSSTRARKVFWSNADGTSTATGPGQIRIDHNFSYLKNTLAFPNYDSSKSAAPDSSCPSCTTWSDWTSGDKGDIGGTGGWTFWTRDYSGNSEGAPLQREELMLFTNNDCGTANGACAKAWQELTGQSGAIDANLIIGNVAGGAGAWNNLGNVPFHLRESRTIADGQQSSTNYFYCSGFANKDAPGNSTNCSGSGSLNIATGKALSRHAHSADQLLWNSAAYPINAVGMFSSGGWTSQGCDHWLDFAYTPYLLTGSYYFLEEEYFSASYCLGHVNPSQGPAYSNNFFGYVNQINAIRDLGWSMQTVGRAAFIAPDSSPEASYYTAMLNSNLEVLEGILGITGTALTPSSINPNCSSYTYTSANRWDWGRCTVISQCLSGVCNSIPAALHQIAVGACPVDTSVVDPTKTSASNATWLYGMVSIPLSGLREMGFSQAAATAGAMQQQLEEMVGDSTFNPYLIATYVNPIKNGNSSTSCNSSLTDSFINTYATLKSAYIGSNAATFNYSPSTQNFACADHGYSLIARAAGSFLQSFGTSSNDPNCSGGVCTAAATWSWLNTYVPFFDNAPPTSNGCGTSDEQIKFALTPR